MKKIVIKNLMKNIIKSIAYINLAFTIIILLFNIINQKNIIDEFVYALGVSFFFGICWGYYETLVKTTAKAIIIKNIVKIFLVGYAIIMFAMGLIMINQNVLDKKSIVITFGGVSFTWLLLYLIAVLVRVRSGMKNAKELQYELKNRKKYKD